MTETTFFAIKQLITVGAAVEEKFPQPKLFAPICFQLTWGSDGFSVPPPAPKGERQGGGGQQQP